MAIIEPLVLLAVLVVLAILIVFVRNFGEFSGKVSGLSDRVDAMAQMLDELRKDGSTHVDAT